MSERIQVFGPTYIDHTIRLKDTMSLDGSSRIEAEDLYPGGTGLCYAIALSRLGNNVFLHSVLGNDDKARIVHELVKTETNIETSWQTVEGMTDYAYLLIDRGNHKTVASRKEISNKFLTDNVAEMELVNSKAIVVTSFRNDISSALLEKVAKEGELRPFTMWAPHLPNCESACIIFPHLSQVDHITLSYEEFESLYNEVGSPIDRGVRSITITNGKNGCKLLTKEGYRHFNAIQVVENPLDTNGAGEAFGAGFLTAYLDTGDYETAIRAGSYVGFLHVQRVGSDFPRLSKNELLKVAKIAKNNIASPRKYLVGSTH